MNWRCRAWARPELENSLLRYLKQIIPPATNQKWKAQISAKEMQKGFVNLLEKWRPDVTICTLLVKAFGKSMDCRECGLAIARQLLGQEETRLFDYLHEIFYFENAGCGLKISILSLWLRILELQSVYSENVMVNANLAQMLLSVLDDYGSMASGVCFRCKHEDEESNGMLSDDESQELMFRVYHCHPESDYRGNCYCVIFFGFFTLEPTER